MARGTARVLKRIEAKLERPLIGFHLPWPGIGRVERSGPAYRFVAA